MAAPTLVDDVQRLARPPALEQRGLLRCRSARLAEAHRFRRRVEYHPADALEDWVEDVGDRYRRPWTVEE